MSKHIERRRKIGPRVRAAAHGQVAAVRPLDSGAERGSHCSAEFADIPGVDDARCGIHRDRPTATTVRQGLRYERLQKILEVERRLDKRVVFEAGRPDHKTLTLRTVRNGRIFFRPIARLSRPESQILETLDEFDHNELRVVHGLELDACLVDHCDAVARLDRDAVNPNRPG